ncbi:hypothetical protein CY35_18G001900 [Sphagnum magellanicum]|nr:hypothetical protein CY35_18G001900 [Sphagnum magellanicum]
MCPSCTSVSRSVRSAAAVVEISMQPVVKITIATNFSAHLHRCVCSLLEPAIMSCEWEVGARDSEKHHAILLTSPSFISPACLDPSGLGSMKMQRGGSWDFCQGLLLQCFSKNIEPESFFSIL